MNRIFESGKMNIHSIKKMREQKASISEPEMKKVTEPEIKNNADISKEEGRKKNNKASNDSKKRTQKER